MGLSSKTGRWVDPKPKRTKEEWKCEIERRLNRMIDAARRDGDEKSLEWAKKSLAEQRLLV